MRTAIAISIANLTVGMGPRQRIRPRQEWRDRHSSRVFVTIVRADQMGGRPWEGWRCVVEGDPALHHSWVSSIFLREECTLSPMRRSEVVDPLAAKIAEERRFREEQREYIADYEKRRLARRASAFAASRGER